MNTEKLVQEHIKALSDQYPADAAPEFSAEDSFLTELRTMLTVDDVRTIRFALEEYWEFVKGGDDEALEGRLEEVESLRSAEDLALHLKILSSIAEAHWKIRYTANKNGVDC